MLFKTTLLSFLIVFSFLANPAIAAVAKVRIACVGDSITFGMRIKNRAEKSYPAQLQTLLGDTFEVGNFGVSGRTLLKKGDRPYWNDRAYRNALSFNPNFVIIKLGTNDIKPANWIYKEQFPIDLKALVESFQKLPSKPTVLLANPVPVQTSRWAMTEENIVNGVMPYVAQVAMEMKLHIVDFHTAVPSERTYFVDGIHPNEAGAEKMAELAYTELKKIVGGTSAAEAQP